MASDFDLGKQIGPLPLGAWIAIVAGGLGIAWYTRNAPSTPEAPPIDPNSDVGTGPGWVAVPPPSNAPSGSTPEIVTNEEWGRQAINQGIALGYDPAVVDSAVRKYLESGTQLTTQEYAIIRELLRKLGSPPVPLPPPMPAPPIIIPKPPVVTPPPVTPKPPPVTSPPSTIKLRYVIVGVWPAWNGSLSGIAKHYYGRGDLWPRIFNANKKGTRRPDGTIGQVSNPDLIFPGWRLWVP